MKSARAHWPESCSAVAAAVATNRAASALHHRGSFWRRRTITSKRSRWLVEVRCGRKRPCPG